jgi:flagellar assembly factor FliW
VQLQTKYFGTLDCQEADVLHFPDGLFGFEEEKQFFLLPFEGGDGSLLCFQSADTPALAFVAVNPFFLKGDYAPVLPPEELRRMGVEKSEELCFYTLCVVRDPVGESTVNLKCPVVINDHTRQAMQVILDSKDYRMHHRLSEFQQKEEAVC